MKPVSSSGVIGDPSVFCVGCVQLRLTLFDWGELLLELDELDIEESETLEDDAAEDGGLSELPLALEPSLVPPQAARIKAQPSATSAALTDA